MKESSGAARARRPRMPQATKAAPEPTGRGPRRRQIVGRRGTTRPRRALQRQRKVATAPTAPRVKPQRQQPDISLRAFAFGLVLVLGTLGVSQPLHQWWSMEREYKALVYQVQQAKEKNAVLEGQINRWGDRAYVASQARARLGYVVPGETQYAVVDPGEDALTPGAATPAHKDGTPRPWYLTIVDTVEAAAEVSHSQIPKPTQTVDEVNEE
ncbi:MAG: septum formation initiator family protein [Actinomycetaceae bacterium]|nr:septum formation initiator family protein [Actinomycetaceae bacterium]